MKMIKKLNLSSLQFKVLMMVAAAMAVALLVSIGRWLSTRSGTTGTCRCT